MPERAAIVTGGSSGIGFAIAKMLGNEGYGITLAARRPDKLEAAAQQLADDGIDVQPVAGVIGDEHAVTSLVAAHQSRYGRIDVLVNNAGVGIGEPIGGLTTKYVDMQLATNLRAVVLMYRECADPLKAAAADNGSSLVVNTASMGGKAGAAWISVYSATKAAVVGFTQSMNQELSPHGVKSTALCPGLVDTPMTGFAQERVAAEDMIRPEDLAFAVQALLKMSPKCIVPEIMFTRPGDAR